jgi:hypothetical protein
MIHVCNFSCPCICPWYYVAWNEFVLQAPGSVLICLCVKSVETFYQVFAKLRVTS